MEGRDAEERWGPQTCLCVKCVLCMVPPGMDLTSSEIWTMSCVWCLMYADDIALLSESQEQSQNILDVLYQAFSDHGL